MKINKEAKHGDYSTKSFHANIKPKNSIKRSNIRIEMEKKQENLKKKKERENKKKLDEKIKIGWDSGLL